MIKKLRLFLSLLFVITAAGMTMSAQDVARIGQTGYATLEEAFAAATDGSTITLLSDCSGNGIKVPQGKYTTGLTVDFGGFTYTMDGNLVGSSGTETQAFQLLKDNNITFNNGTITSEKAKMLVQNYSNLTLDGMTLTLNNANYSGAYTLSNNNGNVVINNTTINANPAGRFAFDVCRYSSYPSVSVTVTGTSVINGDIEVSASGNDAKDGFSLNLNGGTLNGNIVLDASAEAAMAAAPDKVEIQKSSDFTATAPAGYVWNSEGMLEPVPPVAQITRDGVDIKYATLEEAFADAQDGETIVVLADCSGNGIKVPQGKYTQGLTVDFGGFTYTMDGNLVGSSGTQTQAFQLLKDNNITFRNGTITSEKAKMLVQNYSNLTLDGMTLTMNNPDYASAYTLSNNNGNVTIKDSHIVANPAGAFAFDVCRYSSYPKVHVTVTGNSVIDGNIEISASGNDAKDGFSLNLNGGTLNGNIVLDASAEAAMAAAPDKVEIQKSSDFTATAPAGYVWNSEGMLEPVPPVAQITRDGVDIKYATLEEAFADAQDGETITLLSDCSGNGIKVPQGKYTQGLTVDFGGFTYTMDGNLVGSSGTETQAFQLLKDNNITFNNGTIYSEKAKFLVQNYSNLTLNGMTLTLNNANYSGAYTLSNNNGNVVINNTTINANPAGRFAFDVCRYASYPSVSVTVTGTSVINGDIEVSASGNDAKDGFSLNLNGGTLNGNIVLDASAEAAMAAAPEKAVVKQNDTFNADAPAGYIWQSNGDGTSTLEAIPPVAQIERDGVNIQYRTLEEAFAAANDGETIVVLRNCSGNGIKVPQGKFTQGLTVDFGGFTYTMDGNLVGSSGTETQAFQLLKDNNITFNNGTIYSEKAKFLVQNYSNLTLNGMTLTLNNANYSGAYTLSNNNGNVVINNTTINANPAGRFAFDVCRYSSYPSVSVTVTGTSVINGDIEVSASGNDAKDGFSLNLNGGTLNGNIVLDASAEAAMAATPEKAVVKQNDTFNADAPAGYIWQSNGDGTSTLGIPVAQIERDGVNIQYRTLEEAFAAANDGETIVVLRNCSGNGIKVPQGKYTQGLTVDFGGFTYTVDGDLVGSTGTETQAFQLLKDNNITFNNGTIYSEKAKFLVQNYSNLTLNGMTLTLNNANYSGAYTLSNNNGNVVINNTTINANPAGRFAFDVCRYASYPSVSVTVTGTSVINGDIEVSASGSDAKDGFLLYLEEGTLTGNIVLDSSAKAAMAADPDNAVVREKDTFNATVPAGYIWKSEGDGNSVLSIHTVARINTTYYPSLASAVAAAQEGDTVVMIDNSNETATAVVTNAITIDLNGMTVTRAGLALNVQADLIVTDNSANGGGSAPAPARYLRNAEDSETSATQGSIQATGGSGVVAQVTNGATLTLDNVTVHAGNRVVNLINGHLITQNDVTMTSDFMILMSSTTSTNTITINGGTYTGATVGFVVYAGSLTINDGEIVSNNDTAVIFDDGQGFGCDTFTLNDGTLTSARSYAVYLKAGVKGIINDGTINGTAGIVIMNSNYSTTLEFNDGTINSTGFGITNNGQTTANDATTITINGGKINAENVGIYHPGVGNLTITGGEIVGSTGVVLRNGKLSMTGGTIHGTAADKKYDYYDGGSTNTGEGLLIERSNYGEHFGETFNGEEYKGTQVDITYGIFISDHADAVHSYIKGDDTTQAAEEGVERVLNFLNDGWYSNIIPQEHVVEGKYRDENPRSTSPDPRARWTLKSPEPTGISEVLADGKTVEGYYTIDGVRHDRPVKGINIVRFTDNTSKKVILR